MILHCVYLFIFSALIVVVRNNSRCENEYVYAGEWESERRREWKRHIDIYCYYHRHNINKIDFREFVCENEFRNRKPELEPELFIAARWTDMEWYAMCIWIE